MSNILFDEDAQTMEKSMDLYFPTLAFAYKLMPNSRI